MADRVRSSSEPPPARSDPDAWRARIEADLAGVLAAFPPRRRAPPIRRFQANPDPLKPVVPRAAAWPSERFLPPAPGAASSLVYAVGDVHGRYDLLTQLLAAIAADRAAEPSREPVLVLLGDYIDRGPDSALVLEALVRLVQHDPAGVCLLKGNHEQGLLAFLDAPQDGGAWLSFGGRETLAAYGVVTPEPGDAAALRGARDALLAAMPASHLRLVQTLDLMAVVGGHVFVHAGVVPGRPLTAQREADLLWIRDDFLQATRPCAKVVVHGHTWRGAEPELLEGRIGVDTGAYETGVLTAVRLDGPSRRVLRARDPQSGWPGVASAPRLIPTPQDFRRLDWSVELSFRPAAGRAERDRRPAPRVDSGALRF